MHRFCLRGLCRRVVIMFRYGHYNGHDTCDSQVVPENVKVSLGDILYSDFTSGYLVSCRSFYRKNYRKKICPHRVAEHSTLLDVIAVVRPELNLASSFIVSSPHPNGKRIARCEAISTGESKRRGLDGQNLCAKPKPCYLRCLSPAALRHRIGIARPRHQVPLVRRFNNNSTT